MHALTSNIYILNIIMNITSISRACTMHITYMHIVFIMSYKLINILLLLLASIIIINIYICIYIIL